MSTTERTFLDVLAAALSAQLADIGLSVSTQEPEEDFTGIALLLEHDEEGTGGYQLTPILPAAICSAMSIEGIEEALSRIATAACQHLLEATDPLITNSGVQGERILFDDIVTGSVRRAQGIPMNHRQREVVDSIVATCAAVEDRLGQLARNWLSVDQDGVLSPQTDMPDLARQIGVDLDELPELLDRVDRIARLVLDAEGITS